MNINDLVSGRLYKVKNKLESSDYETNEDLVMFLRIVSGKASIITIRGEYKLVSISELCRPESDYLDVFREQDVNNFTKIMKDFFAEYQKYDSIKYTKKSGFKSGKLVLSKLNDKKRELEQLRLLPKVSIAVDNYFEVYKELGLDFEVIEDLMLDFAYIPEWEENFDSLRGFDFNEKRISPRKIKKYTNEALMLHHLYTNLFIRPNFKNIKVEWLDLLIDKFKKYNASVNVNDSILATINSIKWKCMIDNAIPDDEKK